MNLRITSCESHRTTDEFLEATTNVQITDSTVLYGILPGRCRTSCVCVTHFI